MVTFRIYAVVVEGRVSYVGLTQRLLSVRLREHVSRARGDVDALSPFHAQLREHLDAGHGISIRLLGSADSESEAAAIERFEIVAHPEAWNATSGGDVVSDMHAESIASALRGRRRPAITRLRISAGMRRAWRRRRRVTETQIHL